MSNLTKGMARRTLGHFKFAFFIALFFTLEIKNICQDLTNKDPNLFLQLFETLHNNILQWAMLSKLAPNEIGKKAH